VQGLIVGNEFQFLGIPYAAPPVGALRWRPPAAPLAWSGTLNTTEFGADCPQFALAFPESEDCLTLNIYVPASATPTSKLPVMVWFYGGGFISGESRLYDPTALVQAGNVIGITVNYRLGYLGFLAHPALSAIDPNHISGNYGVLDQQASLAWVRTNIANFGGDPNFITAFGESAGGASVIAQLIMANGVKLHSAIAQSGGYLTTYPTLPTAEAAGQAAATKLGCPDQTLACLQALPATTLGNALNSLTDEGAVSPVLDGVNFPQAPAAAFASGAFQHVPFINGSNHDEWRLFVGLDILFGKIFDIPPPPMTPAQYAAQVQSTFGASAAQILALYPASNYTEPYYAWAAVLTDTIFACNTHLLNAQASRYAPVYDYELQDPNAPNGQDLAPPGFSWGAAHSTDLDFIFPDFYEPRALPGPPALTPQQSQLGSTMRGLWLSLARYGRPFAPQSGLWQGFSSPSLYVLGLLPPATHTTTGFVADHRCAYWAPQLLGAAGLPPGSQY
jgi:para-nitrobenzyl esterase